MPRACLALLLLAGCLPADLPEGEPPVPYYLRSPALSDYEMDKAREDMTEDATLYLDKKKFNYSKVDVKVWPNLGVAVRVTTPEPENVRIGQGLAGRLDWRFNRNAYVYRPTGYEYYFKVILAKE